MPSYAALAASFFQEDVRRLHVSKYWYHFAWRVMFSKLNLTPTSLVRLSTNNEQLERHVQYAKTVNLSVVEDRLVKLASGTGFGSGGGRIINALRMCEFDTHVFTNFMDDAVCTLVEAMKKFGIVQNISFTAGQTPPMYSEDCRDVHTSNTIDMFLSVSPHLTSLEIDILDFQPSLEEGDSDWHPCKRINSLLPSLKRLRCRSDTTCRELLDVSNIESTAIEELIVVLMIPSSDRVWRGHCNDTNFENLDSLQYNVRRQAVALAERAPMATQIRVVTFHPKSKVYAFDALTGRRSKLASDLDFADWGARLGGTRLQ